MPCPTAGSCPGFLGGTCILTKQQGHCLHETSPAGARDQVPGQCPGTRAESRTHVLVSSQHQGLLDQEMLSPCSPHAGRWAWWPTLALGLLPVFASGLGSLFAPQSAGAEQYQGVGLRAELLLFHRSSSWSCRDWEKHPSDLGKKGTNPIPDVPHRKEGAESRAGGSRKQGRDCRGTGALPGMRAPLQDCRAVSRAHQM